MKQIFASAAALVLTAGIMGATAGVAAQGPFYHAKAATTAALPTGKFVVRDVVFTCTADGACTSVGKSDSRPQIVCQSLVKEVGSVSAFRAGGQTLDGAALEACNAKAK